MSALAARRRVKVRTVGMGVSFACDRRSSGTRGAARLTRGGAGRRLVAVRNQVTDHDVGIVTLRPDAARSQPTGEPAPKVTNWSRRSERLTGRGAKAEHR